MEARTPSKSKSRAIPLKELILFALLGTVMFLSKWVTEILPNVHFIGAFIVAITATYRLKALFPIYVFVFLMGIFTGFATWWIPYLYIWTVLWAMVMLIPKKLPQLLKSILYVMICSLHGFLYGTLYAPAQALLYGFNFQQTVAWIIAGLPWDLVHGVSNAICGLLIEPLRVALVTQKKARD